MTQPSMMDAIIAARLLNEPGEFNAEYVRGQANLIADMYGPLDAETMNELLIPVIAHQRAIQPFLLALVEALIERMPT